MPLFSRPLSSRSGGTLLAAPVLSRDSPRRVAAKSTTSDHTVTCPSWCTPCAGHSGRVEDCVSRPPDTVTQNHAPGRGSRRTLRHACAQEGARNRSRRSRCREDSLQGSRHHIAERIVPAQLNARRRRTYCGANRRVTPRADRHFLIALARVRRREDSSNRCRRERRAARVGSRRHLQSPSSLVNTCCPSSCPSKWREGTDSGGPAVGAIVAMAGQTASSTLDEHPLGSFLNRVSQVRFLPRALQLLRS